MEHKEEQKQEEFANHILKNKQDVEAFLTENEIEFNTVDHDPVLTMDDMVQKVHFEGKWKDDGIIYAKNLFLYNKKAKDHIWLVIAANETVIDMKGLEKFLQVKSGNLRGADADKLFSLLGCRKGGVNLFAAMNDKDALGVELIMDQSLLDQQGKYVAIHPMTNEATTAIHKDDLSKIIRLSNHFGRHNFIDFKTLVTSSAAASTDKTAKPQKAKSQKDGDSMGKKTKSVDTSKSTQKSKESETHGHKLGVEYYKEQNFSKWYSQVITKSELIEYYDISGCYILRPWSFYIWESIQRYLDEKFKEADVSNCYFPMFVTKDALSKEENHIQGFAPEVAWVTKSGESDLQEPIAIRPTSETIMYPAFHKWVHSHRDLPIRVNQWSNVVRWEFKHPTPFIRTREFLWQEGHTAHADCEGADDMVMTILQAYHDTYEELLAVPVIKGKKSVDEQFAGAYYTTTTEIYVPVSGRGIQGATSHQLGQNFAKMFDVWFEDQKEEKKFVWQTSWGLSTRSIGAMIMVHSDNKGLVLPPKVAQYQIVMMPIIKKDDENNDKYVEKLKEIGKTLKQAKIRNTLDDRDNHNPGWKFNHWELKGVPIRLELGKKDFEKDEVRVCIRHNGEKKQVKIENIAEEMRSILDQIHTDMFNKAEKARDEHMKDVTNWDQFMEALNNRNICMAPWCNRQECEVAVKDKSKEESLKAMEEQNEDEVLLTGSAKTLCIPFVQDPLKEGEQCFACQEKATTRALWGRSY